MFTLNATTLNIQLERMHTYAESHSHEVTHNMLVLKLKLLREVEHESFAMHLKYDKTLSTSPRVNDKFSY